MILYHPWRMPSCKTKIRCGTWTARSIQQGSSSNIVVAKLCASWDALMGLGGKWQGPSEPNHPHFCASNRSFFGAILFIIIFLAKSFQDLPGKHSSISRFLLFVSKSLCFCCFFCVFFLGAVWKDPAGLRLCGYTFLGIQKLSLINPILSRTSSPKASLEVWCLVKRKTFRIVYFPH